MSYIRNDTAKEQQRSQAAGTILHIESDAVGALLHYLLRAESARSESTGIGPGTVTMNRVSGRAALTISSISRSTNLPKCGSEFPE